MKKYTVSYEFERTIREEIEIEIDETDLQEWGSAKNVLEQDSFYDLVDEATEYPRYGEVEIKEMHIEEIEE